MSDINIEELVYEVLENLKKRITNLKKIDINLMKDTIELVNNIQTDNKDIKGFEDYQEEYGLADFRSSN